MTSFKLNYIFKGPIFNVVSHSLVYFGLGLQHMGGGEHNSVHNRE